MVFDQLLVYGASRCRLTRSTNTSTVVLGATYLPMPAPTSSEKSSVSRAPSLWFAPSQGAKYQRSSQSPACAVVAAPSTRAITANNFLLFIGISCFVGNTRTRFLTDAA